MPTNKEIDASMRVSARIAEMIREHHEELVALGQDECDAVFNSHLPLFSVINAARTTMKRMFDTAILKDFDELIDMLKIDDEAH